MKAVRLNHLGGTLLAVAAAGLLAAVGVFVVVLYAQPAEANFPGKPGKIAYAGYDGNDYEIYTINASGRDKIQLTHNKNEFDLSYSPNGKRIVYAGLPGLEDNAESDIYMINAVGSGKTQVTNTDNAHEIHPSWGSRP